MPPARGVAQEIDGTGILEGEEFTRDPKCVEPQTGPLVKVTGMFRQFGESARVTERLAAGRWRSGVGMGNRARSGGGGDLPLPILENSPQRGPLKAGEQCAEPVFTAPQVHVMAEAT